MNEVYLTGTLTKVPTIKTSRGGKPYLHLDLAGKRRVVKEDGNTVEVPYYQRATVFGIAAERLGGSEVGTPVCVKGRLDYSDWVNAEGERRSSLKVAGFAVKTLAKTGIAVSSDSKGQPLMDGGVNEAFFEGNLTRDAELRYTPSGVAVTRLRVAVNEGEGDKRKTHYVDATAWRELAERAANLKKGQPVLVKGSLTSERYTDKEGTVRFAEGVEAGTVEVIDFGSHAKKAPTQEAQAQTRVDDAFPPEEDLPF